MKAHAAPDPMDSPPSLPPRGPPWLHPLTRRADRLALSPFAPVVATLTIAVAGLLASLGSAQIRSAIPIAWLTEVGNDTVWITRCVFDPLLDCRLVVEAALFWFMAVAGSLIFGWREWAKSRRAEAVQSYFIQETDRVGQEIRERTDHLAEQAVELHDRARSLPPESFLQHLREVSATMHEMHRSSLLDAGRESPTALIEEIESALRSCLELARQFERSHRRATRWAINVMPFVPIDEISRTQLLTYEMACPYPSLIYHRDELAGVLVLRTDLSLAVTWPERAAEPIVEFPDPLVPEITLPVPLRPVTESRRKLTLLPGAPFALYANAPAGFTDTRSVGELARHGFELSDGVVGEIARFFDPEENPGIRSMVSLPLLHARRDPLAEIYWDPDDGRDPVALLSPADLPAGVINIHRDKPFMACADERLNLFYPTLLPLLGIVRDLVELYDEALDRVQYPEPGPTPAGN